MIFESQVIKELCAEAGISVKALQEHGDFVEDAYNGSIYEAVCDAIPSYNDDGDIATFEAALVKALESGDVRTLLLTRQRFGLMPIV